MRKTESKMENLSVTGKVVNSHQTRHRPQHKGATPTRPQRRFSATHKVRSYLFIDNSLQHDS